jgi:hypothetical protein
MIQRENPADSKPPFPITDHGLLCPAMSKADRVTYPSLITAQLQFHVASIYCIEIFRADQSAQLACFLAEFSRLGLEMAESGVAGIPIKY